MHKKDLTSSVDNMILNLEGDINIYKLDNTYDNIMNNDTAIKSSIKILSNNGKDLSLKFETSTNLEHPYFTAKLHNYEIGEYVLSNSKVQKAIVNSFDIFYQKFKQSFSFENSTIIIEICGTADGVKIFKGSKYEGDLGENLHIKYQSIDDNMPKEIFLSKGQTLLTNEVYALLRGYVVKSSIETNFPELNPINLHTKTYKQIGPEYRSVSINFKVRNLQKINQVLN